MSKTLRLRIIACAVFEDELHAVAERSANELELVFLDAGLHAAPDRLRLEAQEAIDGAGRAGDCDAVCLGYGLCGRGTTGLIARGVPLVIPRVHDCISLFLGSAEAYAEQFARHPGTFYFTTGWHRHKAHPDHVRMAAARRFDPTRHPHYAEFRDRHGEDNARYIVEFLESWRRNYSRAALIDHGFVTEDQVEATRAVARAAGWDYERLDGSLALVEALADGDWNEERFLVVPPGHVTVATNDERVLAAVPLPEGRGDGDAAAALRALAAEGRVATGTFIVGPALAGEPEAEVGLGIDAGGTYTDAVLFEFATGRILGKAKAPTTHQDLAVGIRNAVRALDQATFDRVGYTCLSTTLATNAIVEERGWPVGLLLMPYHEGHARRVRMPLVRNLGARMTIHGEPEQPVDDDEVLRAAEDLVEQGVAAFAVSGYAAVRNPVHEQHVKHLLLERYGLPVVCGHELSDRLDFTARAHTAVLNARLLPLINALIESAQSVLREAGIRGPLFVVRGDGGVMGTAAARERAIETVLSGPAASAAGGRFLTGCRDALVVDVGGTTTDVAALSDGRLALNEDGAQVGGWRTSVAAADIRTTGLGGDSAARPAGPRRVRLGPDRVVPLCSLGAQWPEVDAELADWQRTAEADGGRPAMPEFFVLAGSPTGHRLDGQERTIVTLLADRPRSRAGLAGACGCTAPELLRTGRLERAGLVRRAGVTPTDALHLLGLYRRFDERAARLGLEALGALVGASAAETAQLIREEAERRLALALVERELTDSGHDAEAMSAAEPLLSHVLQPRDGGTFRLQWEQRRTVVGIGAPVGAFLPGACARLGTTPLVPAEADVANAVGAVVSKVAVRETVRIRPGPQGSYVLYEPEARHEFGRLEEAEQAARQCVVDLVRRRAERFGTAERQVRVEVGRRVGRLQDGSSQLLEIEVSGTLSGAPSLAGGTDD